MNRWWRGGGVVSGFRILAIVPVRCERKNTSVEPTTNHGRPGSLRAPPTRLYIKRGRPPPRPLATQRYLRVVSSLSRTPDYFTLSFEPSFILSRSNNGRHAGRRQHRDLCQGRTPSLSSPILRNHIFPNPLPSLYLSRTGGGRKVMDRPMRGGFFFFYYLLCILSVYCSCEGVKRIKQVRKEKRMCCTEPKRAASASHCPERLRGFFVYTGGSVLFAGAHSPISNRTGTVFSPFMSAAAAALCQLNPARILLRAHRIRPSVRCVACVSAVGGTPPRKSRPVSADELH